MRVVTAVPLDDGHYMLTTGAFLLCWLHGVRRNVLQLMEQEGIPVAATEIRNCGWLAQVDQHGGSIFDYRPHSKGAEDIPKLQREVLRCLRNEQKVVNA